MKIYYFEGQKNISGDRIHQVRATKRISQADLAARMQVKGVFIEREAISKIETGDRIETDIELMIFAGEEIVVDPFSKESLSRTYPFPIFHSAAVVAEDPRAYLEERGLPLTKVHGDWNQARYPLEELGALPGVQLTASNDHDFELVPDRVDKGRAMALIALLYGVPLGETAAVGDSDNDLSMLRAAGLPIAMGNAPAAVREAARRTAPSNQEEGVAWAISRCLEENEWERGEKG